MISRHRIAHDLLDCLYEAEVEVATLRKENAELHTELSRLRSEEDARMLEHGLTLIGEEDSE